MLLELTEKLRNRISEIKSTDFYKDYASTRQDIRMIEIMVNLAELSVENKQPIEKCNYRWFKGSYIIDVDFNGEWKDISDLYSQIVDLMHKQGLIEYS